MSRHPDHPPDTRDPRHLLANDEHLSALQSAQAVAAAKVAAFEQGASNQRKSKRELEKERERLKAVEEEQLAAKAYDEFVKSFGADEDEQGMGPAGAGKGRSVRTMGKGFVRAGGGEGYNPLKEKEKMVQQQPQPSIPTGPKAMRPTAAALLDDDEPAEAAAKVPFGRKKRDMDNFLEELKRDQKVREDRLKLQAGRVGSSVTALAAREHAPVLTGSYDAGDPLTTNIHVAGLPQHVTEQSLGMFFAQYGPIGSVKIMWPRADSVPVGGRRLLGGFVAFLRRPDAEKAAKELDGAEWGGSILRTGWGKAVPLPARAIFEIEGASSRSDRDRERRPQHGRPSSHDRSRRYSSASPSRSRSRSPPRRQWPTLEGGVDDKFLRSVSARIREHGSGFEDMIREKERENPSFAFLYDEKLPSYHYFKMLLDSRYRPPSTVSFVDEGNADIYSSDSAEDSERERTPKGRLGKLAQKRFESMLRSLTSTRDRIGRSMAFALEHADAASFIVDLLVASLTLDGTPVPRKIARLHLVSDILHNSSASLPNAWVYRSIFENRLPEVFDHLGDVYLSFPGRMKAEQFRNQVVDIVDVWERDWILFEPSIIEDFRQRLSGVVSTATEANDSLDAEMASLPPPSTLDASAPSFAPSFAPAEPEPAPVPASEAPPAKRGFKIGGFKTTFQPSALDAELPDEAEDVDGAPVEEDVDGEAVDVDVDGEAVDVDGEAVDVDGEEMLLEDVDGAPFVQEKAATETVVIEDDEAMDLAQSDDDIF